MLKNHETHELYKTGDADAPHCIKDRNGEVVLYLCKRCGRGEVELIEPCGGKENKCTQGYEPQV